jgi:hypothetical protein
MQVLLLLFISSFSFALDESDDIRERLLHPLKIRGIKTDQNLERFGSEDDYPTGSATDSSGNVYVTGYTEGVFSGQSSYGAEDCFVAKFNTSGVLQWARQFGSSGSDYCQGIAIDTAATPNVHVVGYTNGTFAGESSAGQIDIFIAKYNSSTGAQTWITQLGTIKDDYAYGVACDTSQRAIIAGSTRGSFTGFTNLGDLDAYLIGMNSTGTTRWFQQFGTNKDEEALAIGKDSNPRFFPVGYTQGDMPGYTNLGSLDAWVARYSANGAQSWIRQFGTVNLDQALGVAARASSGVSSVVGTTQGAFSGYSNAGGLDVFLAGFALNGTQNFVRQDGTSGADYATAVAVDSTGNPVVGGRTTGAYSGFTNQGQSDIVVAEYTTAGVLTWRQQRGTTGDDTLNGISASTTGINDSVGSTGGTYPGQTNLGAEDAVLMRYSSAGALSFTTQFGTTP